MLEDGKLQPQALDIEEGIIGALMLESGYDPGKRDPGRD